MTTDEAIAAAQQVIADHAAHCLDVENRWLPIEQENRLKAEPPSIALARWVVDTFSEALPCGYETPFVVRRPDGFIGVEIDIGAQCTVAEACSLAAAILRTCDEVA